MSELDLKDLRWDLKSKIGFMITVRVTHLPTSAYVEREGSVGRIYNIRNEALQYLKKMLDNREAVVVE